MKSLATLGLALTTLFSTALSLTVDFDTDVTWIRSQTGQINYYRTDHSYSESGWSFTGGPALRQFIGTDLTDGYPRAIGQYAWKLKDDTSVSWTATFSGSANISSASFAVRRWYSSPSPDFSVYYRTSGSSSFTLAGTIDNTFLGDSSDWTTFDVFSGLSSKGIVVKIEATGTTEPIVIDNFSFTTAAVPESGTTLTFLGLAAFGLILFRRFQT